MSGHVRLALGMGRISSHGHVDESTIADYLVIDDSGTCKVGIEREGVDAV